MMSNKNKKSDIKIMSQKKITKQGPKKKKKKKKEEEEEEERQLPRKNKKQNKTTKNGNSTAQWRRKKKKKGNLKKTCIWAFLSIKKKFIPFIFLPILVGLERKHLSPIIYFPSSLSNQIYSKKVFLPIFSPKFSIHLFHLKQTHPKLYSSKMLR